MSEESTKKHKSSRFRQRRKDAGLCIGCGQPNDSGLSECQPCQDKRNRRSAERLANGLCYCGRPAEPGRKRCPPCGQSIRNAARKIKESRNQRGQCICGSPKETESSQCDRCREKSVRRYRERLDSGLCLCGKQPAVAGKTRCADCLDKIAQKIRNHRESTVRGYGGRCVCCGDNDPNVLELDHVNSDGGEQRKSLTPQGIYRWAIKNGFPPTLQLLCASCHTAKTRTGDCSYRKALVASRR